MYGEGCVLLWVVWGLISAGGLSSCFPKEEGVLVISRMDVAFFGEGCGEWWGKITKLI
jgi:hypothetical protein